MKKEALFFSLFLSLTCMSLAQESAKSNYSTLGPGFLENKGQIKDQIGNCRPDVLFTSYSKGLTLFLTNRGYSYQLYSNSREISHRNSEFSDSNLIQVYRLDIKYLNANTSPVVIREDKRDEQYNFYLSESQEGVEGVGVFDKIRLTDLYPNIDVLWHEEHGDLKYDYIVGSNSNPGKIMFEVKGAEEISIDEKGNLLLKTPFQTIVEEPPFAYQGDKEIAVQWKVIEKNIVGFNVGLYDDSEPLIIDPLVRIWGTYKGGLGKEEIESSAKNGGNIVVAGNTTSYTSIATLGSHQVTLGGSRDAFIAMFNQGGALQWATYFGGASADVGTGCSVDNQSNIIITGFTSSNTGIATSGAHQNVFGGSADAFVAKFNSMGIRIWSTYIGGTSDDRGLTCCTDNAMNIYIGGLTNSTTGIATPGSHKTVLGGGSDAFLTKFDASGNRIWSTYYGGSSSDVANSVAFDGNGHVYLAGNTQSGTGIASSAGYKTSLSGVSDVFLAKFKSSGERLWATYYGGSDEELNGQIIARGKTIYLIGSTKSSNQISTFAAHQINYSGGQDAFLVKFDSSSTVDFATYCGGAGIEYGMDCDEDQLGNIYITGNTGSSTSISTSDGYQIASGGGAQDGFLMKFDSLGTRIWGTYFGGSGTDFSNCVNVGSNNRVFLSGHSNSGNNISTLESHQDSLSGDYDAFVVQLNYCQPSYYTLMASACDEFLSPSAKYTYTATGVYKDTLKNSEGCDSIITINLSISYSDMTFIDTVSCGLYTSPSGNHSYTSSGIYFDTIPSSKGCDSIFRIDLKMIKLDAKVERNGSTLKCPTKNAKYQWYDCVNEQIMFGDTNRTFSPTKSGYYSVIVTKAACIDTSKCTFLDYVGLADENDLNEVVIYPNPSSGFLNILIENADNYDICLKDAFGKTVFIYNLSEKQSTIELPKSLSNGLYFLSIQNELGNSRIEKIVIRR